MATSGFHVLGKKSKIVFYGLFVVMMALQALSGRPAANTHGQFYSTFFLWW